MTSDTFDDAPPARDGRERYEATMSNLREGYSRVRDDLEDWVADLDDWVRDNPARALLVAAGAGFALGLLLRGGRD